MIADIREALLMGVRLARMFPDMALLVGAGAVCCGLTLVAFRAAERHAHRGGALGEH